MYVYLGLVCMYRARASTCIGLGGLVYVYLGLVNRASACVCIGLMYRASACVCIGLMYRANV